MAQQVRGRVLTRRKAQHAASSGQLQLAQAFLDVQVPEGVILLLTDIENTLALRGESHLSEVILTQFKGFKVRGVRYVILRTNKKRKLIKAPLEMRALSCFDGDFQPMVGQLEKIFGEGNVILRQPQKVFWPPWAFGKWPRKPWRATFRSDLSQIQDYLIASGKTPISSSQIMVVGDKIRFDVLRPLLMGWNAVLVNPIGSDGKGDKFALIRPIERFTLWRLGLKRPS